MPARTMSTPAALAEYEEAMFSRSAKAAEEAAKTHKVCFEDENAPRGLIDFLTGVQALAAT